MKSEQRGIGISGVEVTNVSKNGLWILVDATEYFLDYETFPWFRDATIGQICNVELSHGDYLRWPDLDVDLEMDSIEHPEKYPLVFKDPAKATHGEECL